MIPTPSPAVSPEHLAFPAESLDDALRSALSRLDSRKATAVQVRDALAAAGVNVSEQWAAEWLADRRDDDRR